MINVEYINKPDSIYEDNGVSIMSFPELPYFDQESYDIRDNRDFEKLIDDSERVCRNSYEYRLLFSYLKQSEGMNVCTFLQNVTNIDNKTVAIHLHHTPFTLYDICGTVIRKRLHNNESIDIFDIAKEIMWLHYMGYVGLIPVSETVHELIHNQFLFVPTHIVRGNYKQFVDMYREYIDPQAMEALTNAETITLEYLDDPNNPDHIVNSQMRIFNLHSTYINIQNAPDINIQIPIGQNMMSNRIASIKGQPKQLYVLVDKSK